MSHIILRGCCCDIIVLNAHDPTGDKIVYMQDSFYGELEHVFDKFLKYHKKILLGDIKAKVGREDIFKQTTGNESSHEISNDNVVKIIIFTRSKNFINKSTMFPHHNIQNLFEHLVERSTTKLTSLIDRRWHSSVLDVDRTGQQIVILTTTWWWQN
jgi:hypothetical protein